MTGSDFSLLLDQKVDKAYSAFYTNSEKNRLIKEATIKTIQSIYRSLDDQEERDKLFSFIKTNSVFIPINNQIYLTTTNNPNIPDYSNLFSVKAKFEKELFDLEIIGATNNSPITLTIKGQNNLRTYEHISVKNVNGNMAANGSFYIKKIGKDRLELYNDINLQSPSSGNGVYTSGGNIYRIYYNYCETYFSDRKIDVFTTPTVSKPRFEIANTLLKIYPQEHYCSEITVDYLSVPSVFIDVTNNSFDIEQVYPIDLLYNISDVYSNLFAQSVKDAELFNTSSFEIQKNNT